MILRLFIAELRKLREPITLLSLAGPPGLIGALVFMATLRAGGPISWSQLLPTLGQVWAPFLFPMTAIAFTAFAAQIEHRARAWDHLLALPAPKWQVFAVKGVVICLAVFALYPAFVLCAILGGLAGGLITGAGPASTPLELGALASVLGPAAGATLMMVAAQIWIALRFKQVIAPLIIGVGAWGGALVPLAFNSQDDVRFWPWALPYRVISEMARMADAPAQAAASIQEAWVVGVVGGLAVLAAMVVDLSRKELR